MNPWVHPDQADRTVSSRLGKGRLLAIGLTVLVAAAVIGHFGIRRPRIQVTRDASGIYLTNTGASIAEVVRVDAFWYWKSKVGYLVDMPDIAQEVPPQDGQADAQKLAMPDIPRPTEICGNLAPCFMRMVVHYRRPHIPIFRYRLNAYFRFDDEDMVWRLIERMPARYRSMGNMGRGDVEMIEGWQQ